MFAIENEKPARRKKSRLTSREVRAVVTSKAWCDGVQAEPPFQTPRSRRSKRRLCSQGGPWGKLQLSHCACNLRPLLARVSKLMIFKRMTCLDPYPLGKLENLLVPPDYQMGLFSSPENPSPLINSCHPTTL